MSGIVLGTGYPIGAWWPVRREIRQEGVINGHLLGTGASGVGKSSHLYNCCTQEIEEAIRKPGSKSVVVIEPHKDLTIELVNFIGRLSFKYPIEDRVIIINPSDQKYGAVGINILEVFQGQGINPYEVVDETVSCFENIWAGSTGPRMADIIRQSCLLLQENRLTLVQMLRLISDEQYRRALLMNSSNDDLKLFWNVHFGSLKEIEKRNYIESTRNKLAAFCSNPFIRNVISQNPSTINFFKELNRGVVILVCLDKAHLITESRRLFGILMFTKINQALMSRSDLPKEKRTPTSIFIDEFHETFNPLTFLNLLESSRKYCVKLYLYHQSLSQLEPQHINIILSNVGTLACFNVSRFDAQVLSKELFSFDGLKVKYQEGGLLFGKKTKPNFYSVQEENEHAANELMKQNVGELIIRLKSKKYPKPFIANTIKLNFLPRDPETEEKIKQNSAKYFNRSLDNIEKEYAATERKIMSRLKSDFSLEDEQASYRE